MPNHVHLVMVPAEEDGLRATLVEVLGTQYSIITIPLGELGVATPEFHIQLS